jgi:hypothetical protein
MFAAVVANFRFLENTNLITLLSSSGDKRKIKTVKGKN